MKRGIELVIAFDEHGNEIGDKDMFRKSKAPPPPSSRGRMSGDTMTTEPTVPRGHCNRCDRCGWPFSPTREAGCVPGDCSMRPLPEPRGHCAGCGALFAS